MEPRWRYVGAKFAKMNQVTAKMGQDLAKMRPRWAKMKPRSDQMRPGVGQDEPKRSQKGAKRGPRWAKMEPRWRQKVQSKGLCWRLIGLLGAKTVVLKNGVSPRREPHFRVAQGQDKAKMRPRWPYDGAKLAYVRPGLDLRWPM